MRSHIANPTCPRCGYDQSGVVATWDTAGVCPLAGVCSECGLEFAWDDVLGARARTPGWSFEHGRRVELWRLARTLALSLWPWGFWKRLRMEDPIVPARAGAVLLVTFLLTHLSLGVIVGSRVYLLLTGLGAGWGRPVGPFGWFDREMTQSLWKLVWPYGDTRLAGVWPSRAYGWDTPSGVMLLWVAAVPLGFLTLRHTMRQVRVRWAHLWRVWCYSFFGWAVLMVGFAGAAWGFGVELCVRPYPAYWYGNPFDPWFNLAVSAPVRAATTGLWLLLFWGLAIRRYLRLPHAWGVVLAMVVMALLGVVAVVLPLLWGEIGSWMG